MVIDIFPKGIYLVQFKYYEIDFSVYIRLLNMIYFFIFYLLFVVVIRVVVVVVVDVGL